ncbi:MAG TPA: TraB/GumN family protein [Caulobacteraceae bacterium]
MGKLLAALAAVFWCAFSGAAAAMPAMWVVRDADSEIYLFGTVHMLDGRTAWQTPLFQDVYDRARCVWFEADVTGDPAAARAVFARYGVDPSRRLTQKLSPRLMKRLTPLLQREQISYAAVDSLRPWAAAMVLSVQPLQSRGYSVERGADAMVAGQASVSAKTVRTFETVEDQVRMLAALPDEVGEEYLESVIDTQTRPGRGLDQAWAEGDLDALARGLVDDMRRHQPRLYEVLLKDRNEAWARTLTKEMRGNGVQLVNVGALHMVGRDGLPALLKARGFSVERVQ